MTGIIWVTTDCNLKCKYCYEGEDKSAKYMKQETGEAILNFLFEKMKEDFCKDLQIVFHGGEPLLAFKIIKYLVEMCEKIKKEKGIKITYMMTTNGTLLNDEIIDFIVHKIKNISLSIDGDEQTHNYLRVFQNGRETHTLVIKNLKKLLVCLPDLRVRLTYNSDTVSKLSENIKYLVNLGVNCIVPVRDIYDKTWTMETFQNLEEQLINVKKYLHNKKNVQISILDISNISALHPCGGGLVDFNFDPNGNIYPCTFTVGKKEFLLGNVFGNFYFKKRDMLLAYSEQDNKECVGCDLYNFCSQTRCKMLNKIVNGEYLKSSPLACMEQNIWYKVNFKN